jgi:hypothetical protein
MGARALATLSANLDSVMQAHAILLAIYRAPQCKMAVIVILEQQTLPLDAYQEPALGQLVLQLEI